MNIYSFYSLAFVKKALILPEGKSTQYPHPHNEYYDKVWHTHTLCIHITKPTNITNPKEVNSNLNVCVSF